MARIFITGAETGDMSAWSWSRNAYVVPARSGMTGKFCIDLATGEYPYAVKDFGANYSELYLSMLIRRESNTSYGQPILYFFASDSTESLFMWVDSTNWYIQAATDYANAAFANSTPFTIATNTTYRMEVYFKPSTGADGRLIVKIDGSIKIDFTGVTSLKTNIRSLGLSNCRMQSYSNQRFYYDDIIVDDANWVVGTGEMGHKVAALVPSGAGAESDLEVSTPENEDNDKARWLFESGALATDEKGNAGLTLYGSPAADTGDKQQGSSSIRLVKASTQYGKVLDSALPSGFPLKSGEASRVFTLCFWMKPHILTASTYFGIFAKHVVGSNCGWEVCTYGAALRVLYGYSATSAYTWDPVTLTVDKWYFVALKIDGTLNSPYQTARIYDYDAGTWATYVNDPGTAELRICTADIYIGARNAAATPFDGWLDNMRLYPYLLSDQVIDLIRQNKTAYDPFDCVKSIPPSDVVNVKGSVNGDIHTFQMSNLVGSVEAIKGVSLCVRNFLTGAPSAKAVTPVVRIGSTNYLGSAIQAPGWLKPESNPKLWELSPATGVPWTKDELEAAEFGVKLTT